LGHAEAEAIGVIVGLREGTIHRQIAGELIMEITRAQALRRQRMR
jgi:hypothetical protein